MPNTRIYWLHVLSPTHVGIGRGVGYIDLPIDRDGVTGWPIVRASGFKGVWSDYYAVKLIPEPGEENGRTKDRRKLETAESKLLKAAFGVAGEERDSNSGALIPTDAKLVCLPVRSFRGTFAWAASPLSLRMLERTLKLAGCSDVPAAPAGPDDGKAHHTPVSVVVEDGNIYLEDLDFVAQSCDTATAWATLIAENVFDDDSAWKEQFKRRFVVLPDAAFDFLCETGTEVHTRVRIDNETKTVMKGALWTEESLPAETILMGIIQCERVFQGDGSKNEAISPSQLIEQFATQPLTLQIGGKATVGRGQVRCVFREAK